MSFTEWLRRNYGYASLDLVPNHLRMAILAAWSRYNETQKSPGYDDYLEQYKSGDINAIDLQGLLANNGIQMSPEQTQWLNNEISQQVTNESRDYNTQMRDSSITSSADQLSSLGLNPASVLQTGGSGIGNSPVSDTSKGNPAQEKALADFNNKAALSRTLIGLIGGLGSAGILGSTRLLARKAAAAAVSSAANSGMKVVSDKNWESKWSDLMNYFD